MVKQISNKRSYSFDCLYKFDLMTFKDLKKKISGLRLSSEQTEMTELLYGKPFWIWNEIEHKLEDLEPMDIAASTMI